MRQVLFPKRWLAFCLVSLCLSGCAGHKNAGVTVEPKSSLPTGSVVLLDPTTDDGMLPAIAENMSKGAVTIYALDGAGAPVTIGGRVPNMTAPVGEAPMNTTGAPIQLQPPKNMGGAQDPRVTVYSADGRMMAATPSEPARLTPPPLLPPTTAKPVALQSPFNAQGDVIAPPPPPATSKSKTQTVMGSGSRAVTVDDLLSVDALPPDAPAQTVKKKRPPKGMTY